MLNFNPADDVYLDVVLDVVYLMLFVTSKNEDNFVSCYLCVMFFSFTFAMAHHWTQSNFICQLPIYIYIYIYNPK